MNSEEKILIALLVQAFQPTDAQTIQKKAQSQGYDDIVIEDITYVLENMQRRDLLSVIFSRKNNTRVKQYGMAKPLFKKCPEIAHIKDLLPSFAKKKEAKVFLETLEGNSSETKKIRNLGYRDWQMVHVKLKTISPIVGGSLNRPDNIDPDLQKEEVKLKKEKGKAKKNKEDDVFDIGYFNRDFDGNIIMTPNQVRQYFKSKLYVAGVGETALGYVQFSKAVINHGNCTPYFEQWPVIVQGQGRGVKTAEAFPSGVEITTEFIYPFTGTKIKTPEQLKQVLKTLAPIGLGFSCFGKKFGCCELIDFKATNLPF